MFSFPLSNVCDPITVEPVEYAPSEVQPLVVVLSYQFDAPVGANINA